ncbi:hypothetical protein [Bdellovibrio sp. HCB337]|uniref:hypothetical protein n=1 Tax=Bdellovibrio sp. HCB337 TaxID=3394358 RepID=UPI0039A42886
MKKLFAMTLIALSFTTSAFAEETPVSEFLLNLQQTAAATSTSNYCCLHKNGGTYCDMGYEDKFGAPCKCYIGNKGYPGHVCR